MTAETNAAVDFLFGYTGRERDEETGLYYYRARYYDPAADRFVSEDPIGFLAGDANVNCYCGNGPTNRKDPSGLFWGELWNYSKATAAGMAQGALNLGNVVTDTAIAVPNMVPFAWNYTAGWVAPNCPYIPSPDWSKGLIIDEPDWCHSFSKGAGNVALMAGTAALSLQAQAARMAAQRAAARAAADEFFNNPLRQPSYVPPFNPRMPRITPPDLPPHGSLPPPFGPSPVPSPPPVPGPSYLPRTFPN